jgi:hypothetical protein
MDGVGCIREDHPRVGRRELLRGGRVIGRTDRFGGLPVTEAFFWSIRGSRPAIDEGGPREMPRRPTKEPA